MAHNLEIRNEKASFVAVGEKAWHGLGTYVDKAMTSEEAINLGRLNYDVEKQPIQLTNGTVIDNQFATVRTDLNIPLGIVTQSYKIIQNTEAFSFFDSIVDRGEAMFQTAGVLGKGERIFVTAKLPTEIQINGDKIDNYLLLTSGHDGKSAIQVGFTPIRVVCNNTLTAALNGLSNKMTIMHFGNAKQKLETAASVMGMTNKNMEAVCESFTQMANIKITDAKLREYIEAVMKPRNETINKITLEKEYSQRFINTVDNIMEFALHHDTQITDASKNTVFGAYNAISGYLGHLKKYNSQEAKMNDIIFKNGSRTIQKSFDLALQLI